MLESIGPSYQPDKPSPNKDEQPIAQTSEMHDSQGYRFSFFARIRNKQNKRDGKEDKHEYTEENAVELQLSPEAMEKIKRQRYLKKIRNSKQGK